MRETRSVLAHLSDPELIAEVTRLAVQERKAIAALVSALAELDARRLYLGQGYSSMFTYCTQVDFRSRVDVTSRRPGEVEDGCDETATSVFGGEEVFATCARRDSSIGLGTRRRPLSI